MQLRVRHIARNVFSNWLATASTMAVGFFLAPFIVHRLGNEAYGVWVLAISSISYLGLLDLGMRSSVLRFVSKGRTQGDHQGASEALSAALWVRLQISLVVLLLAGTLSYLFPVLFKVPPALAHEARIAVLLIGINLALSMSMTVFGGVVSGLNRYDLQTIVTLVQLVVRATGVILVLRSGHGIVAIALCELAAALSSNTLLIVFARRIYPELQVMFKRPDRAVLRALWSYSFYAFLTTVAVQLVYQTDNLVVGRYVSVAAVAFYAVGNSLCRYSDQFVGAMSMSFVPAASTFEAAGDHKRLQNLYRFGTRAMMALSLPVLTTLLMRGRNFISLWMGAQYAQRSGTVLIILASALIFSQANNTAFSIAFGTERHKRVAKWAIGEGVANLTLSIILVHWMGIYGVAVGTLIPSLFSSLVLWPTYINELIGMNRRQVFLGTWAPMILCVLPFAGVSYLLNTYHPAHSILEFLAETVAILPVFLVAVGILYRGELRSQLIPTARTYLQTKMGLFA